MTLKVVRVLKGRRKTRTPHSPPVIDDGGKLISFSDSLSWNRYELLRKEASESTELNSFKVTPRRLTEMEESSNSQPSMEISAETDWNETVNDETEMENKLNVEEKVEEPKVGMIFNTTNEVFDYYKKYAKQLGFPVTKRSSTKDDDGVLRYVALACARSGTHKRKSAPSEKPRSDVLHPKPSIKTNCKALLSVSICFDGRWRVSSARLDHNHELSPDKACYFRCYRGPKSRAKRKLEVNDKDEVKTNKNSNLLLVKGGGHDNTSILVKDCINYSEKVSQLQLGEGDATSILNYLVKMQAQNADFFYVIDFDKEGRLRNVFWADARSRVAYEEFGNVITFNTTLLTNKHTMPFAPFVGVNHHGQSILFGCGLVSSEDTETFIWLFQSWLACMSGRAPSGIITDHGEAMERAIEKVFPNARHRWCLWHIMKKLPEKLKDYNQYESIMSDLQRTVYDSLSQTEFEEQWNEMIDKYNLHSNDWLIGLYNERHRWVPAFVKESFWAGMSPIQRSESMHAFFDDHVKSKTTLKQFVKMYENALKSSVEKENHEDFKCFSSRVDCVTHYDIEKQAQAVYTISKFKEFQNELTGKMYCDLASVKVDGASSEYHISEDIMIGERKKSVNFKVLFHEGDNEVKCSCCMFDFMGILCRHSIYVLIRHKIRVLPDHYMMRRWRKDVKRCHTIVKIRYNDWNATPEAHRCDKMQKTFNEIKELANDSEDKCVTVMSWMHKLKEELLNPEGNCGKTQPTPELPTSRSLDNDVASISKTQPTPELPTSRSLGNDVTSISKENQNTLSQNHSYGGQNIPLNHFYGGYGLGNLIRPIFYGHHFPASWLACMAGRAPSGIITVHDKAIEKAIENVFPNARHRWCLWHIMKKLPEKLKDYNQYESIMSALQSTVYDSLCQTEFEERWNEIIEKYRLHSNDWLIGLYNEGRRSFVKESFWAGMSPIQRSQSMHAYTTTSLGAVLCERKFLGMKKYENAMKSNVEKENHEDFKCFSLHVDCVTHYDIKKQAQDFYTFKI